MHRIPFNYGRNYNEIKHQNSFQRLLVKKLKSFNLSIVMFQTALILMVSNNLLILLYLPQSDYHGLLQVVEHIHGTILGAQLVQMGYISLLVNSCGYSDPNQLLRMISGLCQLNSAQEFGRYWLIRAVPWVEFFLTNVTENQVILLSTV